jgi:hypothetical protein
LTADALAKARDAHLRTIELDVQSQPSKHACLNGMDNFMT